ncbi:MAG: hypothetical protein IH614_09165 [Desulfuromonadales bacterium]|nr:hypothetical protein [Desulfuromonadales bacterium]
MQHKNRLFRLILLAGLLLALTACGSSRSDDDRAEAGPQFFGVDANGIAYVGSDRCVGCHTGPVRGTEQVMAYLDSKHVVHSTAINAASSAFCLSCHDPIRDGRTLERFLDPARVPAQGLAAVGCENCHGAGGDHFGIGPLPQPTPDFNQCGKCHTALPSGPMGHVGLSASGILENYQDSRHASSVRGGPTNALCARCHSDEGYRQQFAATATLDATELPAFFAGVTAPAVRSPVQCRTCHDSHSGELRTAATVDAGTAGVVFSQEFNLCTSCHQVFLTATPDAASGKFTYLLDPAKSHFLASGGHPNAGAASIVIDDTHFANQGGTIAGYNIDAAAANACTACHDPHGATKFAQPGVQLIAEDWATSGHGDYQGEPFAHTFTDPACLKCHSGPQYARSVQGVAAASLDLSGGGQVVSCVACHDLTARDSGGSFALGALRPVDAVTFPSGATVSLGGPSNVCMECHQGRSSTPTVNARIAAGNLGFSNIHYYAAAATLFGTEVQGGYQYAGQSYRGRNGFADHAALGLPQLTTCAGCHVGSAADHSFMVPVGQCVGCHPGSSFETLAGSPSINFNVIGTLKGQLLDLLQASGVVQLDGFPYFSNITTAAQLRAAYNWQVADKEPCGYIHNGIYIRQLLYDSIADLGGVPAFPRP